MQTLFRRKNFNTGNATFQHHDSGVRMPLRLNIEACLLILFGRHREFLSKCSVDLAQCHSDSYRPNAIKTQYPTSEAGI